MPVLSGVTRVLGARGRSSEVPPQFFGVGGGHTGLESKMLYIRKTNAQTSWQR